MHFRLFKAIRRRSVLFFGLAGIVWLAELNQPSFAAPSITKVEPPSWWANHPVNPVRLMIAGKGLRDVEVISPSGFQVEDLRASGDGRHLFFNLTIPTSARPGVVDLRLCFAGVTNSIPFEVLPGPVSASRGLTADDVIYLVLLDRFANGDPANDDPAVSRGLLDRTRPRRYHGGDFQGVIDHLDYLKELGVTALWLTPWYDNVNHLNEIQIYSRDHQGELPSEPSADYHGYGVVDFYSTDEHLGDLAALKKLVDRAHDAGLKVIQDQVVNLTSPYHPWLEHPPTPSWYNGTPEHHLTNTFQTWTATVPHPPADQLRCTLEGWFFDYLPDLNQNDPELAAYLIQNSLWWIDRTGVDAIRQDALPHVPRSYWARWGAALKRQQPQLTLVGEMWDGDARRVAFFQGGRTQFDGVDSRVDTLFDFPLHYALRDVFVQGRPVSRLKEALAGDTNYVDASRLVTFLGLHDQIRFLSEPGATLESLKLAFSFLFTARGVPLVYYGDEIGMTGETDPDNRRDFPGGWREDVQNAFTATGRTRSQEEVRAHVAKLIQVRKSLPALRQGRLSHLLEQRDVWAFARIAGNEFAVVVINNSKHREFLEIPLGTLPSGIMVNPTLTDWLGSLGTQRVTNELLRVTLPPRRAAVFAPDHGQTSR